MSTAKPEVTDERTAVNREIAQSVETLRNVGHASFQNGDGQLKLRILEHVRGVALDRGWDYRAINWLGDLSIEHLGIYAGILEGEIQAVKEDRAAADSGAGPDIGI